MSSIWITGGKGFIGRHLAQFVAGNSQTVHGLGHGAWVEDEFSACGFKSWLNAEIDFASLSHLAASSGLPDIIFHLAGGSAVGPSIQNPYEDFQRTVETTARLLEWVRQHSHQTRVIGASSAAVYGSGFSTPIPENTHAMPFSPYGFHKAMLEKLFDSYRETYGLKLGIVRLYSIYGPGLEKQLLWDICQKLEKSANGEILLHGTGQELRDWLHIKDTCSLLWKVATLPDLPQVINGGTGKSTSIFDIAHLVSDAWGEKHKVVFNGIGRKGDPASLVADTTLSQQLGYTPSINIQDGIKGVVHWYRERSR
ncbi:UDP-glucose 4-epimerase [Methylophilus rhizosphaerae]|uniref:UDP-glucose 4-epimerase n=1 Tax=Methylophilus rhizosphaerae TaxID=492660 RepID=A0A1G8ZAM6_9PROT|nr:SDR family oxidoreductase [Methylophilus rhizosphaerae]SDK12132.1 UDP-glucose 4-epimerase [Methylophilus rhizosphaerae]